MPDKNGLKVVEKTKALIAETGLAMPKTLLISNIGDPRLKEAALRECDWFIKKPSPPGKFKEIMDTLI